MNDAMPDVLVHNSYGKSAVRLTNAHEEGRCRE